MKRKWVLVASLAAATALAAVFAGMGSSASTKSLKIGVANYTLSAPYFVGMSKAVQSEAKPYKNISVYVTDANGDAAKFTSNIQDLLTKKPNGLRNGGTFVVAVNNRDVALSQPSCSAKMRRGGPRRISPSCRSYCESLNGRAGFPREIKYRLHLRHF